MRIDELVAFAQERHSIYERRKNNQPKPWTEDPILQRYRFCNAYRELDKVTVWIRTHWREPNEYCGPIWLPMTIARFINNIPCLEQMPLPMIWDKRTKDRTIEYLKARKQRKEQVFGGAYMVRSDPGCKIDYLASVLDALWHDRVYIMDLIDSSQTLGEIYAQLCRYRGMGSFMVAQILADLKHTRPFLGKTDWMTFAASGPGSQRGLCRVLGTKEISHTYWSEENWYEAFITLYKLSEKRIKKAKMIMPDAQDFQGWLCEFDKYERTRLGEGTPRSRYNGMN